MDIKKLHEKYADYQSPTVEGQVRWLQTQNFPKHHIEQAMLTVYGELERGEIPRVWTKDKEIKYLNGKMDHLAKDGWSVRDIRDGKDLDQYLLETAKVIRTKELTDVIANMERFWEKERKKWEDEQRGKKSLLRRIFT